jgi:AraC-like DNA-binding protein
MAAQIHKDEFLFSREKPFKSGISILDENLNHVHTHNGLEIGCIISGKADFYYNGIKYGLQTHDIFFLDAIIPHWTNPSSNHQVKVIWITFPLDFIISFIFGRIDLRLLLPFIATRTGLPPVINHRKDLCSTITSVNKYYKKKIMDWDMYANARIHGIMVEIAKCVLPMIRKGQNHLFGKINNIINAIFFINSNFKKSYTVERLAQSCFLSCSRLSHLFSETMGISPMEYRNQLRINYVIEKLCATQQSISAIAEECGFKSMPYFYKIFKNHTGINPHSFRQSLIDKGSSLYESKS